MVVKRDDNSKHDKIGINKILQSSDGGQKWSELKIFRTRDGISNAKAEFKAPAKLGSGGVILGFTTTDPECFTGNTEVKGNKTKRH